MANGDQSKNHHGEKLRTGNFPKLATERLILRQIKPEDAQDLFELYSAPESD